VAGFAFELDSANYERLGQPGLDKPGLKLEENMENADVAFVLKSVMIGDTTHRSDKLASYVVIRPSRSAGNGVQYHYLIYKPLETGDNVIIVTKALSLNSVLVSQYLFFRKK
jgi:hypothetical protein